MIARAAASIASGGPGHPSNERPSPDRADMGVVFRHEDDTVNPEAQPLGETKLMPRGIKLSVLD
jgi:hypothetical protein